MRSTHRMPLSTNRWYVAGCPVLGCGDGSNGCNGSHYRSVKVSRAIPPVYSSLKQTLVQMS